jgi:[acyl-carrier-protein] S-malonyltransferase
MGQSLAESLPAAVDLFRRASAVLGYDLAELCFHGPQERLNATDVSQPALYVTSLAALEKLKATEPQTVANCSAAAGLSLGEYTALTFAGVWDYEVGLRLVQIRGEGMQAASEAQPSGMISVLGLEAPQLEEICQQARQGEILEIANLLCPLNTVLSGSQAACARASELATAAGAMKVIPLAVAGAFHTQLMSSRP